MFGRRKRTESDDAGSDAAAPQRGPGPYDARELPEDEDGVARLDLGGLRIPAAEGIELRLQADQSTGTVQSVLLAADGAALELRAFAAPKSGGLWDEVRREIVAEATKQGGTASERDGEHGAEVTVQVPAQLPDGRRGLQISRIVGVEGPRWFLRGTFLGRAAQQPDTDGVLERAFRNIVVVRGQIAMPPRDAIGLNLPADARIGQTPAEGPA